MKHQPAVYQPYYDFWVPVPNYPTQAGWNHPQNNQYMSCQYQGQSMQGNSFVLAEGTIEMPNVNNRKRQRSDEPQWNYETPAKQPLWQPTVEEPPPEPYCPLPDIFSPKSLPDDFFEDNSQNVDLDIGMAGTLPLSDDFSQLTQYMSLTGIDPDVCFPVDRLGDLSIPASSEEANKILSDLVACDVDARDLMTSTMGRETFAPSTSQAAEPEEDDLVKKNTSFRARDLPTCWHSAHIEGCITEKRFPSAVSAKPVVRCVHCRDEFYQLPENLFRHFHDALGNRTHDQCKRHTIALFLDMGEYDLLVCLLFSKQHDENSIASNQRRVQFECGNALDASDIGEEVHAFADEVLCRALIGYFDVLGKCGYNTAHFKAEDEASQLWCKKLIDRAIVDGSVQDCKDLDGNKVYHYYEWLSKMASRRNMSKMPMFEDDTLPTAIEETINDQLRKKGKFDRDKMWLKVNQTLKNQDPCSFLVEFSYNTGALAARCWCPYCKDVADCRMFATSNLRNEESIFDSCAKFANAAEAYSLRFDSLELAQLSTNECIQYVVC